MKCNVKILLILLPFLIVGLKADIVSGRSPQSKSAEKLIFPNNVKEFVILKPTNKKKDDYPVLEVFKENAENKKVMEDLYETSFMEESVKLYFFVQNYLINQNKIEKHEPAYLLLSNNVGGFPQFDGFYLKKGEEILNKTKVPYIELVKRTGKKENFLWSIAQIYPHEMGHVFVEMLSSDSDKNVPKSIDVHYASIVTNYQNAFNEGFAEHFEVISLDYEIDENLKNDILQDLKYKNESIDQKIRGFELDFKLPLRLDYYRISMVLWFQTLEAIKRYSWVKEGKLIYENKTLDIDDIEEALMYRNSGVQVNRTHKKNLQQMLSTEGSVSTFFVNLVNSKLKNRYLNEDFYRKFLITEPENPIKPEELVSPLENIYFKIFHVFFSHVNIIETRESQLIDFIKGYAEEYPDEKNDINNIFKKTTGYSTNIPVGPDLWILNKNQEHNFWELDQFGGHTMPFYTFNLNTAGPLDICTFDKIRKDEAEKIVSYRNNKGFISSLNEIYDIPGISEESAEILNHSGYDFEYVNSFNQEDFFSIKNLFVSIISHFLFRVIIYFFIFSVTFYLVFKRNEPNRLKIAGKIVLLKFPKMFLFAIIGLICISVTGNPFLYFVIISVVFMLIECIIRRKPQKRKEALFSTALMALMIIYSL